MTPQTLMTLSGLALFDSGSMLIANFISIWKNPGSMLDGKNNAFAAHAILGSLTALSGTGLAAGFVWFLVATYS